MNDRSALPKASYAANPPSGLERSPRTLVSTPVWCGYWPVIIDVREGQQNESATKAWEYDAPTRRMASALRIVWSRSIEKSSIRTSTMLGRCFGSLACFESPEGFGVDSASVTRSRSAPGSSVIGSRATSGPPQPASVSNSAMVTYRVALIGPTSRATPLAAGSDDPARGCPAA